MSGTPHNGLGHHLSDFTVARVRAWKRVNKHTLMERPQNGAAEKPPARSSDLPWTPRQQA